MKDSWTRPSRTGWFTSFVVHTLLLVLLLCAGVMLPAGDVPMTLVLTSGRADDTPLQSVTLEFSDLALEGMPGELSPAQHLGDLPPIDLPRLATTHAPRAGQSDGLTDYEPLDLFAGQASFFGITAYGNSFVYLLDMSGSMNVRQGPSAEGSRYDRAVWELLQSVDRLTEDQSFYVILFSDRTLRLWDDRARAPAMVPATAKNKARLRVWLSRIRPGGDTDPRLSLRLALSMSPSAIFLLSDGEFNGREMGLNLGLFQGNPSVEQVVARHNQDQVSVHTLAFEDPIGSARMQSLARTTGGEFVYIPPRPVQPLEPDPTRVATNP